MFPPLRNRSSSRLLLWSLACLLVLRAAVPLLASTAARLQGKAVADVCSIYGVAIADASPHAGHEGHHHHAEASDAGVWHEHDHRHHGGGHEALHGSGDHCALTAIATFAPPDASQVPLLPVVLQATASVARGNAPPAQDACAAWIAWLQHGPPRA